MEKLTLQKAKTMKPLGFWTNFYEMCQIPHESGHCKKLSDHFVKRLKELGAYEVKQDKYFNVIGYFKGTKGKERAPTVLLQGHMDMVCVACDGKKIDFTKDPIEPVIDGDFVRANDTSLGADNGAGVCAILAYLTDKTNVHGPLEVLFTTDEEPGCLSIPLLPSLWVKSKYCINLDYEGDPDVVCLGGMGCIDQNGTLPIQRGRMQDHKVLKISGGHFAGGHSGVCAHTKVINVIKILFHFLYRVVVENKIDLRIINIKAGMVKNAIPSIFEAEVAVNKSLISKVQSLGRNFSNNLRSEYKGFDDYFEWRIEQINHSPKLPLTKKSNLTAINVFNGVFNGMHIYSSKFKISECSTNVGVFKMDEKKIYTEWYVRGMNHFGIDRIAAMVDSVFALGGGKTETIERVPCWIPQFEGNKFLDYYAECFKKTQGHECKKEVMPGGGEAGGLVDKYSSLQSAISATIEIYDVHSTQERLAIKGPSVIMKTLKEALANINNIK